MKVLLIDDEEELVSTLAERLEIRDIECDYTTSGEDGLRKVMENDYDRVVVDLKMPGLGGLETIRKIKEKKPECAVIVVTGMSTSNDLDQAISYGAERVIAKPVDIDELLDILRAM